MIIPNYLPEGLTVLGGKPNGKSCRARRICRRAEGGKCLGQQCEQGDVLALARRQRPAIARRPTTMVGNLIMNGQNA